MSTPAIEIEVARHQVSHCRAAMDALASAVYPGGPVLDHHPEAVILASRAWISLEKLLKKEAAPRDVWVHIGHISRHFYELDRRTFAQN